MAGILSSMVPQGRRDLDPTGSMLQLNEGTQFQQQHPDAEPEKEKRKQRKKKELEPLTVEAFLNAGHLPSAQSKSSKDAGRKPPEEISKTPGSAKPGKLDEVEGANCESVGQSWEEQRETPPREPQDEMEICEEESQAGLEEEEASKKYHFAWESMDADKLSEMTISSVHTSDLSSFDDDEEAEGRSTDKEAPSSNADETAGESRSEPKIEAPESVELISKKGLCE